MPSGHADRGSKREKTKENIASTEAQIAIGTS